MAISLIGAVCVGLIGIAFVQDRGVKLNDPETLFILMGQILFHPLVGRLSVLIIAIISIIIAWTNDTILNLVGNAWAGFGAAFGHWYYYLSIGRD